VEVVKAYFKALFQHLLSGMEETHQDKQHLSQEPNPGSSECRTELSVIRRFLQASQLSYTYGSEVKYKNSYINPCMHINIHLIIHSIPPLWTHSFKFLSHTHFQQCSLLFILRNISFLTILNTVIYNPLPIIIV
jgi:hypothetical protein